MFPHVFEAGLHETLPRDRVLLASTAVVYHHTLAPAIQETLKAQPPANMLFHAMSRKTMSLEI